MSTVSWPDSGELQRRITIRVWSDVPNAAFGLDHIYDAGIQRWAKLEPVSGLQYWGTQQIAESPTHRVWVRYGTGTKPEDITGQHVIEHGGRRYRVLRTTNIEDAQRFTMIEAKDLGSIA